MKQLLLCFLLLITVLQVSAQQSQYDSVKIRQTAIRDADNSFKLNRTIRKAFRQKQLYSTSDYFKPNLNTTKESNLLRDSNYIKVFRHTAFENVVYQIKLNRTKLVIVGVVVAGIAVVAVIIVKIADAITNGLVSILGGIK